MADDAVVAEVAIRAPAEAVYAMFTDPAELRAAAREGTDVGDHVRGGGPRLFNPFGWRPRAWRGLLDS
jgi:hypothetical protein